ncbi:cytochrome P450 724B1-like [Curcuma longa]|uniref:cytochrome P450 724B1-like n=1 Tax=Curcuma longa TaxID=136217 RepID=UPI003D9E2543
MMKGGELLCVLLMAGFVVLLILVLNHLLPLLLNHGVAPGGNFGWPFFGETLRFLIPHASYTLGRFLEDHCARYGKVFKSHLFCTPTIVSCDQELNHFILQNEEKLFQCSYPRPIHGILGKSSMIVVVGDTHRKLRSLALTLLTTTKSRTGYLIDIDRIALEVIAAWNDKQRIFLCEEARKFTFRVIVKQVLGMSHGESQTERILEDFLTFMKGLISFPLYIPGTSYAKAVQARARISFTVKNILVMRQNGGDSSKKGDFLDELLSASNLSEEEKVSFVLDALLGGYETTSLLISMAVYFLGQCPSALEQLKSEHETIRANKKEECLTSEDYRKMEFTQHVINETLRCGNIVKFVHRKALKDVRYKDYLIPCGWKVLPVFSAAHLDSSLYKNPHEFDPWRWKVQNQTSSKRFTPFGGGPRLCPGSELAKVEAAFFLHYMVLNFRWKVDCEDIPMAYPYVEFQRQLPLQIIPTSSTY